MLHMITFKTEQECLKQNTDSFVFYKTTDIDQILIANDFRISMKQLRIIGIGNGLYAFRFNFLRPHILTHCANLSFPLQQILKKFLYPGTGGSWNMPDQQGLAPKQ